MNACESNFNTVWHSHYTYRMLYSENEEAAFEAFKLVWNLAIDAAKNAAVNDADVEDLVCN